VTGVQLDGGEGSLSVCGSGDSVVREGSRGDGKTGSSIGIRGGKAIRITGDSGGGSDKLGATTLPLGTGVSGDSGIKKGMEFGLSGGDLRGVNDGGGAYLGMDGGYKGSGGEGSGGGGKVGTRHLETIDGVSNIVDNLEDTVSVHILIRALGNSISVARLSSGRWATSITESELSKLVLSMELMSLLWLKGPGGDSEQLSAGGAHASCQYNQSVHFEFLRIRALHVT